MEVQFTSDSPWDTIEFGRKIGEKLRGGEVFAITGTLGTGKTHFIKGIAAGLGIDSMHVNSPTFVLVNEYHGRLDMYHIDAYRLETERDFEMLGFYDFCYENSVVLIEWADKVRGILSGIDFIEVTLSHISQSKRQINISNAPDYLIL